MANTPRILTLDQHIAQNEAQLNASGEFSSLLRAIGLAGRLVNDLVRRAGLTDILGALDNTNVQGEVQQKLDVRADDEFLRALRLTGLACAAASEEQDHLIELNCPQGNYVLLFDPLDGSSNIDVNVPVGSIFSIYRRLSPVGVPATLADVLQPGRQQLCAGYLLYGSSTMLVYTTGHGVNGFTLDPHLGEFFLTHANMQLPAKTKYYSLNDSKLAEFEPGMQQYIMGLRQRVASGEDLSPRYVGSLVADFHRNLLKGGVFLYPGTIKKPQGKLRLCYEANPMALLMEQAGGAGTDGRQAILDIVPQELHQRVPLVLGSKTECVRLAESLAQALGSPAVAPALAALS
jgi:fructose-1,6-bisphosphatase I